MNIINFCRHVISGLFLLLAFSLTANAYEIQFINDKNAEFSAIKKGQYSHAIEELRRSIEDASTNQGTQMVNLCTALVVSKRFYEASEACNQAIEAKGNYVGAALNSRGVMHALSGQYEAALADFALAADNSSHPLIDSQALWAKMPAMPNRSTPDSNFHELTAIAMRNHDFADRKWAAIQESQAEELKAAVEE